MFSAHSESLVDQRFYVISFKGTIIVGSLSPGDTYTISVHLAVTRPSRRIQ